MLKFKFNNWDILMDQNFRKLTNKDELVILNKENEICLLLKKKLKNIEIVQFGYSNSVEIGIQKLLITESFRYEPETTIFEDVL